MRRRHLFEFNEISWMPACIRTLVTDYLRTLFDLTEPFSPQLPLLARALQKAGTNAKVVDLCSGGGGPWRHLSPQLDRLAGRRVAVVLTDKYPPRLGSPADTGAEAVTWHECPVDATAVPASLPGMRTLFNGFHHFRPPAARRILAAAVACNEPIVVMEMLRRSWLDLFVLLLTPLLVWLLTPWIRPFSWTRLVLTYVLPLAPLIIVWDTFVSVLRCYTPQELRHMGETVGCDRYEWFAGAYRYSRVPVTFLVGYPRRRDESAHD